MKNIISISLFSFIATVNALTVGEYESMKEKSPREICSYLSGLSNGFYWSESMDLKSNEKNKKFCPEKQQIPLNCQNHLSLIDNQIKLLRQTTISSPLVSNESPIEPTFYGVMRKAYSCK